VSHTGRVESKTYNGYGQPLTHTDFKGQVSKYFYDTDPGRADPQNPSLRLGRLTAVEYYVNAGASTPAEAVQYRYDREGRQDNVIDSVAGTTDYGYDADGRLVRVMGAAGPAQTIHYGYDAATGRLTRMSTDKSEALYGHDKLGRLQTVTLTKRDGVTLTNQERTEYAFDLAGNLMTITQKVGTPVVLTSTLGYDALNRLTSRVNKDGANNTLSSFTYTRLADGQISGLTETVKQPGGTFVDTTATYTYDALNRLVREEVNTAGTADDYTIDYTLDLVSNRVKKLTTRGSGVVERVEGTFDARDRLTQEQIYNAAVGGTLLDTITNGYDHNGSLTLRQTTSGSKTEQTWDLRGRQSGATVYQLQSGVWVVQTTASYQYTAEGIRSRVTENGTTTLHTIDGLSPSGYAQVIEERTLAGALLASYAYGASLDPISQWRSGQVMNLYLGDGHSGVRQAIDLAAAVLLAQRFDAFGNTVAAAGTLVNQIGYRGERFDPTLGQYYLRARFYDPRTGRFTAMDPFAGNMTNPAQSMRYGYAGANPVLRMDPSGKDFFSALGALVVGAIQGIGRGLSAVGNFATYLSAKATIWLYAVFAPLVAQWNRVLGWLNTAWTRIASLPGAVWDRIRTTFSAAQQTFSRLVPGGGLQAHEGVNRGHTLARHVAQSSSQLQARLASQNIQAASTFADRASAEEAIAIAIENRAAQIDTWLRGGAPRLDFVEGFNYNIGVTLVRGQDALTTASNTFVLLVRDASMSIGYRVQTAYPTLAEVRLPRP
jgi:RHS repeat-associated protein